MTTHPEHDVLIAFADHELADDEARAVGTHIAECVQCSAVTSSLRSDTADFASLLHALDAEEPYAWRAAATAAHSPADVIPLRQPTRHPAQQPARHMDGLTVRSPVLRPQRILRWAAGVLLATATAAAAAVVALDVWPVTVITERLPSVQSAAVEQGVATVIGVPADGRLAVALGSAGAGTRLHITLTDDGDPAVAVTGPAAPRFTVTIGRIDAALGAGTSLVHVRVPRTLNRVDVTLDGNVVATVDRGTVTPAAAAAPGGTTLRTNDTPPQ